MRGVVPEPLRTEDPREIAGYPLYARIGEGGMGTVYLSRSRGGQPVALKLVRPEYAGSPAFRERFAREVAAGYECGTSLENYQDVKVGDVIEPYEVEQVARRLATPGKGAQPATA